MQGLVRLYGDAAAMATRAYDRSNENGAGQSRRRELRIAWETRDQYLRTSGICGA
jgi:hypothetical protein